MENNYNNNNGYNVRLEHALGFRFHCVYGKKTIYPKYSFVMINGTDDCVSKIANVVQSTLKC